MKHLFVHERLLDVWKRNSDKDDSPAQNIREVNSFACLSSADTIQDTFVSILDMSFVLINGLSGTFGLKELSFPRLNPAIYPMKISIFLILKISLNGVLHGIAR